MNWNFKKQKNTTNIQMGDEGLGETLYKGKDKQLNLICTKLKSGFLEKRKCKNSKIFFRCFVTILKSQNELIFFSFDLTQFQINCNWKTKENLKKRMCTLNKKTPNKKQKKNPLLKDIFKELNRLKLICISFFSLNILICFFSFVKTSIENKKNFSFFDFAKIFLVFCYFQKKKNSKFSCYLF